jgi:hypothetical protein
MGLASRALTLGKQDEKGSKDRGRQGENRSLRSSLDIAPVGRCKIGWSDTVGTLHRRRARVLAKVAARPQTLPGNAAKIGAAHRRIQMKKQIARARAKIGPMLQSVMAPGHRADQQIKAHDAVHARLFTPKTPKKEI